MAALRDGRVDAAAAGAHTALTAFPQWHGAKLVVALAQGTPWLLVLRANIPALRGDLSAVKGLHLGAAPGPDAALRRLLADGGIDPARDGGHINPVPGWTRPGLLCILAAQALESGRPMGFGPMPSARKRRCAVEWARFSWMCGAAMARPGRETTRSVRWLRPTR